MSGSYKCFHSRRTRQIRVYYVVYIWGVPIYYRFYTLTEVMVALGEKCIGFGTWQSFKYHSEQLHPWVHMVMELSLYVCHMAMISIFVCDDIQVTLTSPSSNGKSKWIIFVTTVF